MEEEQTAHQGSPAPTGRLALLLPMAGTWLAVTASLLLVMAAFGTRLGLWQFRTGFAILGYGGWCGALAGVTALASIVTSIRHRRFLGLVLSLTALTIGSIAFAVPLSWKLAAGRLPRIHDISTDISNPPRFVAVIPLRKDAPNPNEYGGAEVATLQRQAYPDLKTIILEVPQQQAFALALDTAQGMGWTIVATAPLEGRIEATDTTRWFGFKDDIVIRITSAVNRSLVDIRSVSRVGISDVGTNARRIRAYLKRLGG